MDTEVLARARYAAYAQRRTMPPRCNPFGILLLVLSLGILFIGLTMTIIANWPGATSIGENPLRVAGPVLLASGLFLLVVAIILVVFLNQYERSKWEGKLTNLAADRVRESSSREVLVVRLQPSVPENMPYAPKPGMGGKYNGGFGDQEPSSSRASGPYPIKDKYNVDMLPDPNRRSDPSEKFHDVSLDPEDNVPDPVRVHKKKPASGKNSSNVSFNNSYSSGAGEADLGIPGMAMSSPPKGYLNTSFEAEREKGRSAGRGQKIDKLGVRERQTPDSAGDPIRDALRQKMPSDPQRLRVHIKAQPGTAVHITPSATPPLARHSNRNPGKTSLDTSGETEI